MSLTLLPLANRLATNGSTTAQRLDQTPFTHRSTAIIRITSSNDYAGGTFTVEQSNDGITWLPLTDIFENFVRVLAADTEENQFFDVYLPAYIRVTQAGRTAGTVSASIINGTQHQWMVGPLGRSGVAGPARVPTTLLFPEPLIQGVPGSQWNAAVIVLDQFGDEIPGAPVSYSSDSPAIATVSATGLVTILQTGNFIITALNNTGPVTIDGVLPGYGAGTFTPPGQTVVIVTPATIPALTTAGATVQLTATVTNGSGATTWTSSAPGVAAVSATGLVTAVANGSATITATNNGVSAGRNVTVNIAAGADTTPPVVSITAPAANATVSGLVTLTATATDVGGIASVQFQVDGVNHGAAVTAAPYTISWSTASVTAGTHTIRAIATDNAGNTTTSAAVSVTVSAAATVTLAPRWALGPASFANQAAIDTFVAGMTMATQQWNGTALVATVDNGRGAQFVTQTDNQPAATAFLWFAFTQTALGTEPTIFDSNNSFAFGATFDSVTGVTSVQGGVTYGLRRSSFANAYPANTIIRSQA